jgi:hypothetical protein
MADDPQGHPEDTPPDVTSGAARIGAWSVGTDPGERRPGFSVGARLVDAGMPAAPDWDALPVPPEVRAACLAALGEVPTGSAERVLVEQRWEVALLEAAVPGAALARWLDGLDPGSLSARGVVEAVAASARVESWAHARTARWAGVLAREPEMEPHWSRLAGPPPRQRSVAGDELAMRLGVSRIAANRLVREGIAYEEVLQATGEALEAGRVDASRARVLVDRLAELPWEVATQVEDRVLPGAGRRAVAELERDVARALLEVDPQGVGELHDRAYASRRVSRPRMLPDGMASLSVLLAAQDAVRVDGVLRRQALAAKNLGDPRTLDQLRADGLRDLVVGTDLPVDGPAWEVGSSTVVLDGERVGVTVYQRVPDGVAEVGAERGADGVVADGAVADGAAGAVHADDETADQPARSAGGMRPGAQVFITISAATLLGIDDQPAELHGYGPIDAVRARALAAGGVWRRIVTDPRSGTVLDVGRTRYRPPAALAEHVRLRDRTCVRPGCTVPAEHADLDHTRCFHQQPGDPPGTELGTTCAANLAPLCHRDHRLKTDGGHTLHQYAPGLFEWITPTGQRYRSRPGTRDHVRTTSDDPDAPPPF